MLADRKLLEVTLTNLLDNAAKYSTNSPVITLDIEKVEDTITITVKDNGIGIANEDLEKIVQHFYRVNKTHSKKLGGSGLGLSIVETIVKKHSGTIFVASEYGKCTTFIIVMKDKAKSC